MQLSSLSKLESLALSTGDVDPPCVLCLDVDFSVFPSLRYIQSATACFRLNIGNVADLLQLQALWHISLYDAKPNPQLRLHRMHSFALPGLKLKQSRRDVQLNVHTQQ